MAKKSKKVSIPSPKKVDYPRMGLPLRSTGVPIILHKRAKFAPELIAEGFAEGVSAEQGNLLKSYFDDPQSNDVDPATNINSDKFELMSQGLEPESPSVDSD